MIIYAIQQITAWLDGLENMQIYCEEWKVFFPFCLSVSYYQIFFLIDREMMLMGTSVMQQ